MRKLLELILTIIQLCFAYVISKFITKNDDYFLIGSNYGGDHDPNSLALFDYIKSQNYTVYLVSNKKLKQSSIIRGTIECAIKLIDAKAVFYTHSLSDIAPQVHKIPFVLKLLQASKHIFIQHGVTGLKSRISPTKLLKDYFMSLERSFDIVTVSSLMEKSIIQGFGVNEKKLFVAGMPRFDMLPNSPPSDNRSILIFFTWQNNDKYINKCKEVLDSGIMKNLVLRGYSLNIVVHNMQNLIQFDSVYKRDIKELSDLVLSSRILITDDSSIAWDFFYKKAHVIFYKPANNWLIDKTILKIFVALNESDLEKQLLNISENLSNPKVFNFALYNDRFNCKRTFELAFLN